MIQIIEQLLEHRELPQEEARGIMNRIMSGEFDNAQIAGFLIALRAKGESSGEIAGFAEAMRAHMTPVPISDPDTAIDMCGTGGDACGTFNISTAASLVAAGGGVKVAKHGNRSMTSKSGSADVLAALGVNITMDPEKVARCVDDIGIGFMFAPSLHPAMKYAAGARKSLKVRTVFNILGPLSNPAGVRRQVLGVFNRRLTDKLARVLKRLGAKEALIVHGDDGLDEISTTSSTHVSLLSNGDIQTAVISPLDYGIKTAVMEGLTGGTPEQNAEIIRRVLEGETGAYRDIVVFNAAAGFRVGGRAENLKAGIKLAEDAIDTGAALDVLKRLAGA